MITRRKEKNKTKKANKTKMTITVAMSQTMKMKVVHNWHRIMATQCVTDVEKRSPCVRLSNEGQNSKE